MKIPVVEDEPKLIRTGRRRGAGTRSHLAHPTEFLQSYTSKLIPYDALVISWSSACWAGFLH